MGKWYKIEGISKTMYEAWKDELRQDIIIWEDDNNKIEARIKLTILEALILKLKMKNNYYGLRLIKLF